MAGFNSPLFLLGLGTSTAVSAGFRTPLPPFQAGATTTVSAGFRTPLPSFPAGADTTVLAGFRNPAPWWLGGSDGIEVPEAPTGGGGGYPFYVIHPEDRELVERLRKAELDQLIEKLEAKPRKAKVTERTLKLREKKKDTLRADIRRLQALIAEARQREQFELFRAKTARELMLERLRLQEEEAIALILIMSEV